MKNSFEYDARVTKEAKALLAAGHEVTVVALRVPKVTPQEEVTPDGIHVLRIPRSSLGVPALNRVAARYAGTIEARHARLTGEPYDAAKARELGRFSSPSTATPGDDATPSRPDSAPDARPTRWSRGWASVTTPLLRAVARLARFTFRSAKSVLGRQGSRLTQWAIDKRMTKVGVSLAADVYHSHDLNTLGVGVACKKRLGAKLVYDSHELQTERSRMTSRQRSRALREERKWMTDADALIVASPSWIDWNRRLYGSLPEPSVAVLNVPEPTEVVPLDLRAAVGLHPDTALLVYQGSIQENRGIEPAIDAVRMLEGVALVVIGYGYHRPALEELVEREGLGDRVRFFGPVPNDELLAYTATADAGLCNIVNSSVSYHTSLPNKLFEYITAGVPVIGSDSPEIGRVVTETGVGEVCDPEDPAALAAAATKILAQPGRYRDALAAAATRYHWGVEHKKLLEVYEEL
ncbi:MAG: glycosyltransferase [Acidimicrobiia bacterium]